MENQRYTVEHRKGCTLVFGSMPVTDLVALTKGAGDQVMSPDLARLAGAQFAWGLPEDVDAMSDALRVPAVDELAGLRCSFARGRERYPDRFGAGIGRSGRPHRDPHSC